MQLAQLWEGSAQACTATSVSKWQQAMRSLEGTVPQPLVKTKSYWSRMGLLRWLAGKAQGEGHVTTEAEMRVLVATGSDK